MLIQYMMIILLLMPYIINAFRMGCRKYRLHRIYGWRVGKLYNIYIICILVIDISR